MPFLHIHPSEAKTYVHLKICANMFIAALLIIAKNWKLYKYLSTCEWISKLWYIHTMDYYSATKRNKQLVHTTYMILKYIILSERRQTQKTTYCVIPFIWHSGKGKSIRTEIRSVGVLGEAEGLMAEWHRGGFWGDGTVLYQLWWWLHNCMYLSNSQHYTLKRVNFTLCNWSLIRTNENNKILK